MAQGRSARAINQREKTRICNLQLRDQENEVSKIFIIPLSLIGHMGKETFKFSGPYSELRPAKLTNHTVHTCTN